MKKINLLLVLLTLTSCNLNSSKGYEFAHSALDSLLNEVTYDESIEVKNALYHEYDEDSNLNEVVEKASRRKPRREFTYLQNFLFFNIVI